MKRVLTNLKIQPLLFLVIFMWASISKINAQLPELWGMTNKGGDFDAGVIFKTGMNTNNQSVLHSFAFDNEGKYTKYIKLCEAINGKLYGLTIQGGLYDFGVLFEYDPVLNVYSKKLDFDNVNNGREARGSLILADNNKLYGMTCYGGAYSYGTIFEYDPLTNTHSKIYDFQYSDGRSPMGSLLQASNGKLYGMTYEGGINNKGVLFEFDITTNTIVKILDFNGVNNGSKPWGNSLIQADNGDLYGMTTEGGIYDQGVIFRFDIANNILEKILDFDTDNGKWPHGELMQAENGKLYGMTYAGGVYGRGVLFEYNPELATYIKKIDFNDGANYGSFPNGSLTQGNNGNLYGMTKSGGTNNKGIIFEYNSVNNTLTKKKDFGGSNGDYPFGSLIEKSPGHFYGVTSEGGSNGFGVLFEYNTSTNSFLKKLDFNTADNGYEPYGSFIQGGNNKLYCPVTYGGISGYGVLAEYDPITNEYTKKQDFNGVSLGVRPRGNLIQATNGKLYGMTEYGGTYGAGVLYEYDYINNILVKKLDFYMTSRGAYPEGGLVQASNGKLYGMTSNGGLNYDGTLFEYDLINNAFTKRLDFDGDNYGAQPQGGLTQAINGKLYGMTLAGGVNNFGVLFEYDPVTNIFTKKIDFIGTNGKSPYGNLIEANNGKLYGVTMYGGDWPAVGVLFEYDPIEDTCVVKINFGQEGAANPRGSLLEGSNGKLYGMTKNGGVYNHGVVYEYDIDSNTFAKILDFEGNNGREPLSNLIEILGTPGIEFTPSNQTINAGQTFTTSVNITGIADFGGFEFEIEFDPALLQADSITLESFLSSTGRIPTQPVYVIDNYNGLIEYGVATVDTSLPGPQGDGPLVTIHWAALDSLENSTITDLILQNVQVSKTDGSIIPINIDNSEVTITGSLTTCIISRITCPEEVIVPITFSNIQDITNFNLVVNYDSSEITYDSYKNVTPMFSGVSITDNGTNLTIIYSGNSVSVEQDTLLELKFIAIPKTTEISSALSWNLGASVFNNSTGSVTALYNDGLVTIEPIPDNPGSINGLDSVCYGSNGISYRIDTVPNATSYFWHLTPETAGNIYNNGINITINFSSSYSGLATLSVNGINDCGQGEISYKEINIIGELSVDAGLNAATGNSNPYILQGSAINQQSSLWVSSGDGMFDNPTQLSASYTPGIDDIANDSVILSLTAVALSPCVSNATDDMILYIRPTQQLDFLEGWNLMSFYVEPVNQNLLNNLQPIVSNGELIKVIDETGGFIQDIPGIGWMNTIGNMANTEGYYIKVVNNNSLNVYGDIVTLPINIPLYTGWNIMGYPMQNGQDAPTALQSIINNGSLTKVIDESGGFIQNIPGIGWMNTIGNFEPGEGYYIKLNANDTLTIYENSSKAVSQNTTIKEGLYYQRESSGNPFMPMHIVASFEHLDMEAGDELGVFANEVCIGSTQITDPTKPITTFLTTNDPTTANIDGGVEGEALSFKLFHRSREYPLITEYEIQYNPLETRVITFDLTGVELDESKERGFIVSEVIPNPFSSEARIYVTIPETGKLKIELLDLRGVLIKTLFESDVIAKNQEVIIAGNNLNQGMYFVHVRYQNDRELQDVLRRILVK